MSDEQQQQPMMVSAADASDKKWSYGPMMRWQAEELTRSLAINRPELVVVRIEAADRADPAQDQ